MRHVSHPTALLLAALAMPLAACGSPQPAATETAAATTSESTTVAAPDGSPAPAAAIAVSPEPVQAKGDPIRGKGGLEERCLKEVARQGTKVIGTNRIEESQAAIEVYVNVEGGQAPWRCRGNRDGSIESVEYTETEGAL